LPARVKMVTCVVNNFVEVAVPVTQWPLQTCRCHGLFVSFFVVCLFLDGILHLMNVYGYGRVHVIDRAKSG
jgi:hypothetical protein